MPITKAGNGVITESPFTGKDQFDRCGVAPAGSFAIADSSDHLKQIKFDASSQTTNTSVTIKSGANSSDVVFTLPTTSGTLSTSSGAESFVKTEYIYDFAVDGGAAGFIDLSAKTNYSPLPSGNVVVIVGAKALTDYVSSGSTNIKIRNADNRTYINSSSSTNYVTAEFPNVSTSPSSGTNSLSRRQVGIEISGDDLTAGKIAVTVFHYSTS